MFFNYNDFTIVSGVKITEPAVEYVAVSAVPLNFSLCGQRKESRILRWTRKLFGRQGKVKFIEKTVKKAPWGYGVKTYETYEAATKVDALVFLETVEVDKDLYYIVVLTPEGNWGKDRMGIYEESWTAPGQRTTAQIVISADELEKQCGQNPPEAPKVSKKAETELSDPVTKSVWADFRAGNWTNALLEINNHLSHPASQPSTKEQLSSLLKRLKEVENKMLESDSLYNVGDFEGGIALLKEAIAIADNAHCQRKLGASYYRQGNNNKAEEHFMNALNMNPKDCEAHFNLGILLGKNGSFSEANSHIAKAAILGLGQALNMMLGLSENGGAVTCDLCAGSASIPKNVNTDADIRWVGPNIAFYCPLCISVICSECGRKSSQVTMNPVCSTCGTKLKLLSEI
jgi:tetratricopeptide (TPR) repeat protein